MFSIAFMVVAFVLDNPETQTVSHSFRKVSAALQKKFGADAAIASRRFQFQKRGQLSSARTMKRFPSSRCASTIYIARPRSRTQIALESFLIAGRGDDSAS
jgi:hypothetical protein